MKGKRENSLVILSVSVLMLAAAAMAQNEPGGSLGSPLSPATGSVVAKSKIQGTVQLVDPVGGSLQVKEDSGSLTLLKVQPDTEIKRSGKSVELSDLKVGDSVTVKTP